MSHGNAEFQTNYDLIYVALNWIFGHKNRGLLMSGNMMLTIGVIVLLTLFTLSANKIILQNKISSSESEYIITAIGLAQSVINEAKTKSFDEKVASGSVTSASQLTPSASLGKETGESPVQPDVSSSSTFQSYSKFDDIDDYNGYTRSVSTPRAGGYTVNVAVSYVSETDPETSSSSQTYCKKMTVTVTSPFITIPVKLFYAFTY
jgi:hypothetical protein